MGFLSGSSSGIKPKKPKPLGVDEDRFSGNEQAKPVPYFAGKFRIAVNFISDVFDVRHSSDTKEGGKKPIRTGFKYFAGFAAAIAHGPIDAIHAVILNGEQVWPDADAATLPNILERDVDNPDFVDLTVPDYGLIRFYWGTETQPADDYLKFKSGIVHPPYRGIAYLVAHQFFLGFNQTNVQNFEVIASRYPTIEGIHAKIGNDANPLSVIHELLTHPRLGRGLDPSRLDVAAFQAVADILEDEGLGISPLLTSQESALDWVVKILEYIDGYPIITPAGQISFGLYRPKPSFAGLPVVDENLMADPPNMSPEDWSATFSQTNVKFSNPDQNFDPDAKSWRDRGNFQITGDLATQTLERPWITNPNLAQFQADAIGRTKAIPEVKGTLNLRHTLAFDDLTPGAAFLLRYPLRSDRDILCTVTERSVADPGRPLYSIGFRVDRTYLLNGMSLEDFTPAGEEPAEDVPQIEHQRLIELRPGLGDDGKINLVVICSRPTVLCTSFSVHLAKNYDFGGLITAESFQLITTSPNYAFRGALLEDYPDSTAETDDTVGLSLKLTGPDTDLPEETEFDGLSDELLIFVNDEILSVFQVQLIGVDQYRLFAIRKRYRTAQANHSAGDEAFVIRRSDLVAFDDEIFQAGRTASVKVQAHTGRNSAPIEDQSAMDLVLTGYLRASADLNFPSVSAGGTQDLTINVPGARGGDLVTLGLPAPDSGIVFEAWVSSNDTVTVRAHNITGSPINPASATFRVLIAR